MVDIGDYIFRETVDTQSHIIATYSVSAGNLLSAAKEIAIGQSIGNPDVRTERDTPEILKNNLAKIVGLPRDFEDRGNSGTIQIAYPLENLGTDDGVSQLLCMTMGGQMDIDNITACRLEDLQLPHSYMREFKGPQIGMDEIKKRTTAIGRPLLGGIVKPKTGITVPQLVELVDEMLVGGVDFIKEDEILGSPGFCDFYERVPAVLEVVRRREEEQGREIFYTPCINANPAEAMKRAQFASEAGAKAVHLNFHAGLGVYQDLRELDLDDTAIFFQKSGDKVLTSERNAYSIAWPVVCKLARLSGVDFIHAGMWGGYSSYSFDDLSDILEELRGENGYNATVPSLSCGSNPGLVDTTMANFGENVMMNVGGAIQGHPMGTTAGAIAMRQAMDKPLEENMVAYMQDKPELKAAIEKWGYVVPESGNLLLKESG